MKPTGPLRRRSSGRRCDLPRARPASTSASARTRCGTRTRRICWKPARTCARSRCCSATPISRTRRSISTCRGATCKRRPIRSSNCTCRRRWSSPVAAPAKTARVVSRPAVEVADILHAQGDTFVEQHPWLSVQQRSVLRAIARCRTAALGGHLDRCDACGHQAISYNSCRNRHCPKCQAQARERWLHARERDLLDVPYVHVVFTLPHALLPLTYRNSARLYTWLFQASAATLREVAADPRHLGAEIGVLSILHTWGQTLVRHPHVHCVVPAGGLSPDHQRWIRPKYAGFFLPVKVLSRVFRGKFVDGVAPRLHRNATRSRRRHRAPARPGAVARLHRRALRDRLGRLREAGLRWRVSRAALSRALHASRRDQQSPAARLRRRPRHLSVEGLRARRTSRAR